MTQPFTTKNTVGYNEYSHKHIGEPNLLEFDDTKRTGSCVSVNLYNNIWGTNFPMWYGEDGKIRFKINII